MSLPYRSEFVDRKTRADPHLIALLLDMAFLIEDKENGDVLPGRPEGLESFNWCMECASTHNSGTITNYDRAIS